MRFLVQVDILRRRIKLNGALATLACVGGALCAPARLSAQKTVADTVRGTVTDSSGKPVAGTTIAVTGAGTAKTTIVTPDSVGRFTLVIPTPYESYLVSVLINAHAISRATLRRVGDSHSFQHDFVIALPSAPQQLQSVSVKSHPRPSREVAESPGEQVTTFGMGLHARTNPVPNLEITPDGRFSFAGMDPSQTQVTFKGIPLPSIPFAAGGLMARVSSTPFDAERGGFGGGQLLYLNTFAGSQRVVYAGVNGPLRQPGNVRGGLTGSVPIRQELGIVLGGTDDGPSETDSREKMYGLTVSGARTSSSLPTLLGGAPGLSTFGILGDSVRRFVEAVGGAGLPLSGLHGSDRMTQSLNATGFWYNYTNAYTSDGTVLSFIAVRDETDNAASLGPWSLSTGQQSSGDGTFGLVFSQAMTPHLLHIEFGAALSTTTTRSAAYLGLPAATVLVTSDSAGQLGSAALRFAGSDYPTTRSTTTRLELHHSTSAVSANSAHRFQAGEQIELNSVRDESASGLGSFTFNSIADVAASRPASFSRTLSSQKRSARSMVPAIYARERWRASERFVLTTGLRMDGITFLTSRGRNPAVESMFGRRTDERPNELHFSPMGGFTWRYAVSKLGFPYTLMASLGRAQGSASPSATLATFDATGLPSGAKMVSCVGAAVPVVDWRALALHPESAPTQCVGGVMLNPLVTEAPSVVLFQRGFSSPGRWAARAIWSAYFEHAGSVTVTGDVSRGQHIASRMDLNLARVTQTQLPAEGGRPLFVGVQGIDAATGAVSSRTSRRFSDYSSVTELRSDLHNLNRALSVVIHPPRRSPFRRFDLRYSYSATTEETRGIEGTSAGDPNIVERSRSQSPSHEVMLRATLSDGKQHRPLVSLIGWLRSGARFTPMVSGDINGDGFADDRAFIFDPAHSAASLGMPMQTLLASLPERVRTCLSRQLGSIAARNSCTAPPSAALELTTSSGFPGTDGRVTLSMNTQNLLAGLDMLLHGAGHEHGWGDVQSVDAVLLRPVGFDAASRAFTYQVNQHFGKPIEGIQGYRAPFQVTLMASVSLGPTWNEIEANRTVQLSGNLARSARSLDSLTRVFEKRFAYRDLAARVIAVKDSIALTDAQLAALQKVSAQIEPLVRMEAIERAELALDPVLRGNRKELGKRLAALDDRTSDEITKICAPLLGILGQDQIEDLPEQIRYELARALALS